MEKKKILVVDDEEKFGKMVKINLEKTGSYEVDTALNAMDSFEKIRHRSYDLIFLDVLMPKIEGAEALEAIKRMCQVPVVIMSAYLPPERQRALLHDGAADFLEKPFALEKALHVIHRILAATEAAKAKK